MLIRFKMKNVGRERYKMSCVDDIIYSHVIEKTYTTVLKNFQCNTICNGLNAPIIIDGLVFHTLQVYFIALIGN